MNEGRLSNALWDLTKACMEHGAETSGGLLGGEFGYGAWVDNDVFMMHPFCWCEKDGCPWCVGCSCPEGSVIYRIDGQPVDFDAWLGAPRERRDSELVPEKQCAYCKKDVKEAPNFLFKPTGGEVRW